jgi:hypothetical protein
VTKIGLNSRKSTERWEFIDKGEVGLSGWKITKRKY